MRFRSGGRERNIGTEPWRRQDHLTEEFTVRFSPLALDQNPLRHEREDEEGGKKERNWKKQLRV